MAERFIKQGQCRFPKHTHGSPAATVGAEEEAL